MGPILVSGMLSLATLALIGLVVAELTRPLWRTVPALGPSFAVIGVALTGWLQFLASWVNPQFGQFFAFALVLSAVLIGGYLRVWRIVVDHPAILLITAGVLLLYLGLTFLWVTKDSDPFSLSAVRYSFSTTPYPIDNAIPLLMANAIRSGAGTQSLILDWNGSDRPPLQSGVIITTQTVYAGLGQPGSSLAFGTGVALQLTWIPALWSVLRVLRVERRIANLSLVFAASTATMLINSVYTWPKLASAALVLVAFALLIAVIQRRLAMVTGITVAALAVTLAMLCHGAAAFALPAVIVLAVAAIVRRSGWLRTGAIAAGIVLLTYAPWVAYQRWFEPPGDRLLKWHLAGVTSFDDRSLWESLIDAYRSISPSEWLASKLQNLGVVVDPFFYGSSRVNPAVVLDAKVADPIVGVQRFDEYYASVSALGVSALLLGGIAFYLVVALARGRTPRRSGLLKLMALMVPCLLLWCLVMFIPGSTVVHQGSHVWIVVVIGASFAWVASLRSWVGVPLVVLQAAVSAWFYVPFFDHTQLRLGGLAVLLAGIAVVLVAFALDHHRGRIRIATARSRASS